MDKICKMLESLVQEAPYGILAIENANEILIANEQATQLLKLDNREQMLIGKSVFECFDHIQSLKAKLKDSLKHNNSSFDLDAFLFDDRFLNIRGRQVDEGYIVTIEDITRDKEMEMVALNSMLEAQELERRRIAKEIHDGVGPNLSIIKLMFEAINTETSWELSPKANSKMKDVFELIDSVASDIRSISHQLMPKVLLDFGIIPATENMINQINRTEKIKIIFFHSVVSGRYAELIELGIYRICQELINNAVKHSGAKEVQVQIIEHSSSIILMVEDNGKGFNKQDIMNENPGVGLINIESRTNALGGNFILDTSTTKGVSVTVEIPLEK
ncbi:histidine kinase [Ancylomarina sp. DW003]|nr:ATP-binding protein [Ancylomarina sp. DW003]MDE5421077.1 histidine kinase [Ancylomarina sp. DW003]